MNQTMTKVLTTCVFVGRMRNGIYPKKFCIQESLFCQLAKGFEVEICNKIWVLFEVLFKRREECMCEPKKDFATQALSEQHVHTFSGILHKKRADFGHNITQ